MKNVVRSVDAGSPLAGKVLPGWQLLSVNGNGIRDVLDYKYHTYDSRLRMTFRTETGGEKTLRVRKEEGEDPGLVFETYLMDAPRACANKCVFCFIDQNPPGMRDSIYFKDDDARLSFLMGCYITLTNLGERELQRIIDLKISPVNVSVHATDPELRTRMLRNPRAGEVLPMLQRLADAHITLNCQIVCCPGWNDGGALLHTLEDLRSLYPAVNSISVVPVGLTDHRDGLTELRPFTREAAADTVTAVEAFASDCLERFGTRLAFCSDELYLRAGMELPENEYYEEHVQLENGVGMLRLLEAEFLDALPSEGAASGKPFTVACGSAAAPILQKLLFTAAEKCDTIQGKVIVVPNRFYGESVTVSGLLTGSDLLSALKDCDLGEYVLISADMFRREEVDFLDGVTLAELSEALGVPVIPLENDGAVLCDAFFGRLPELPQPAAAPENPQYNKYN